MVCHIDRSGYSINQLGLVFYVKCELFNVQNELYLDIQISWKLVRFRMVIQ